MYKIKDAFEREIEIDYCEECNGIGNLVKWDRQSKSFIYDPNYPCDRCKGAKYIVVSYWRKPIEL